MRRSIPDPPGIREARTLPAAWYADASHHAAEVELIFRRGWVCVGLVDEMPTPGSWRSTAVGGVPVLMVRDREGELRGFLDVCRHRAAPLCEPGGSGEGPLLRCPYHAWLYRLDGTLAKAAGMGEPDDFDADDFALRPVQVASWRRFVFVAVGPEVEPLDLGPLAEAVDSFPLEEFDVVRTESHERAFNWKVLLENYSENYHTPFVHPEIDTTSTEDYPMVSEGHVLYAWDRPLRPSTEADQLRHDLLPGEPGWERLAAADTHRPYDVGSYLTVWPNLMLNVFPDAGLAMWMRPLSANRTIVERRLLVRPGTSAEECERIVETHQLVHQQDVDICEAVQRSHDAGLDADGRLATFQERGVFWVHQLTRAALSHVVSPVG